MFKIGDEVKAKWRRKRLEEGVMFKIGDEVICVVETKQYGPVATNKFKDRKLRTVLHAGQVYKILDIDDDFFLQLNNKQKGYWSDWRFIPNTPEAKAEWMRKKLEEDV